MTFDAPQQVDLELFFEVSDLLTQGRLRGVQTVRGAAEMELFRDPDEVSKMAKLQ